MVQFKVLRFLICKILHAVGLGQVYLQVYNWIFYVQREETKTRTNHYLHSLPQLMVSVQEDVFPLWRVEEGNGSCEQEKKDIAVLLN